MCAPSFSQAHRAHLYPHLLILLPSPCTRGEGLGVRGFALCFNYSCRALGADETVATNHEGAIVRDLLQWRSAWAGDVS